MSLNNTRRRELELMKQLWAVYDEDGECVGVDVEADTEQGALSQFAYANSGWSARVQDAQTAASDGSERRE
jgi:hypothetical protein